MLPKPEKISKKKINSEQEELPKVVDPEIKIAALRKKRLMIAIGLGFTVVLSIIFSLYRFFKTTKISIPKINPPSINLNTKQDKNVISNIDKLLSDHQKVWNIYITDSNSQTPYKYSNSNTNFDYDFEKANPKLYQDNNQIKQSLPGGVVVKYYSSTQNNNYIGNILMQNPLQDIQVSFIVFNSEDYSEEKIIETVSLLSQKIYWSLVSN